MYLLYICTYMQLTSQEKVKMCINSTMNNTIRMCMSHLSIHPLYTPYNICKSHAEVLTNNTIHPYLLIGDIVIGQYNAHSLSSAFTLQKHRVASKELQLVHFLL